MVNRIPWSLTWHLRQLLIYSCFAELNLFHFKHALYQVVSVRLGAISRCILSWVDIASYPAPSDRRMNCSMWSSIRQCYVLSKIHRQEGFNNECLWLSRKILTSHHLQRTLDQFTKRECIYVRRTSHHSLSSLEKFNVFRHRWCNQLWCVVPRRRSTLWS